MFELDHSILREDRGSGETFLQLADVAGPGVTQHRATRFGRERELAGIDAPQQPGKQQAEVLSPLAQRREVHGEPAQPHQQIVAELFLRDQARQVAMRGGDDTHVHLGGPGSADRHHLFLLKHAQERRLRRQRKVADLVEQQRPALRAADQSRAVFHGAGEGTFAVAEHLRFHERRWQGAAVHWKERTGAAGEVVDRGRDDLLAGTGFPLQEHRETGLRDGADALELVGERGDKGFQAWGRRFQCRRLEHVSGLR